MRSVIGSKFPFPASAPGTESLPRRTHLHQTDKAADAFQAALGVFPGHTPALHALGTLYERSGNWPFALEMLAG